MKTQSTHGGNVWQWARDLNISHREILDFSANINPLGTPDCLRGIICGQIENLVHYPDPDCSQLTRAIAGHFGISPQQIVCGNGSSELLYAVPRALNADRAVLPAPCYVDYARAAEAARVKTVYILPENDSSPSFAKKPCDLPHGRMASLASEGFAKIQPSQSGLRSQELCSGGVGPEALLRRSRLPRGLPRGASLCFSK